MTANSTSSISADTRICEVPVDYWIDKYGHLDLSSCYMRMGYDMFKVMNVSHEYYFAELQNLVAWDGLPIRGMNSEAKWRHLICKHGHDGPEINPKWLGTYSIVRPHEL